MTASTAVQRDRPVIILKLPVILFEYYYLSFRTILTGVVAAEEGGDDLEAAVAAGLHGGDVPRGFDEGCPEGRRVVPRVALGEESRRDGKSKNSFIVGRQPAGF